MNNDGVWECSNCGCNHFIIKVDNNDRIEDIECCKCGGK